MPRGEAKIFECVSCFKKYSKQDAERGRFYPLTNVCRKCYRKMSAAKPKIFCFGKLAKDKLPGYSATNEVCNKLCPDCTVCKEFIQQKEKK